MTQTLQMNHTNFPIATPIPIDVLNTFADLIDWNEYYGRWGTEKLIWSDFFICGHVPEHLKGKVTHVWLYFEK